ncbi:MAG TPA: DUF763 domain-containing protein [bacterium]|nr:DUF763 domain-containing protein [bacterium]
MKKTGSVYLPLHRGKIPPYLFSLMKNLGREIVLQIIERYGTEEFLRRLSHPVWFQSLGCLLGFDWHSSGLTTATLSALKEAISPLSPDIGLFITGGKGEKGIETPKEIEYWSDKSGIDGERLIYCSRMTAKVDNVALQDGYSIYQHFFIFDEKGRWVVIQQGMNPSFSMARRYHWIWEGLKSFIDEPHKGICGKREKEVLNLVADESKECRESIVNMLEEKNEILKFIHNARNIKLPERHQIFWRNTDEKRLEKVFLDIIEKKVKDFETLIGIRGVGPVTVRALALICEIIEGKRPSYKDPVRYTFAHGGKDGHPFPVKREVYIESINFLTEVLKNCKIPPLEKERKLKKLATLLPD